MYDVLEGIKVVEVASWTFVPTAAAVLADWGADVVKVEHPVTGDPQRGLINALTSDTGPNPMMEVPNRGKRSIAIDISEPDGLTLLYRLVAEADVFITNFLSKTRASLRIDASDILGQNPAIIYARGTGQGLVGPEAERGGFDMSAAWARGGLAYLMAHDGVPPFMPASIGDLTGGLNLAGGIAAALLRRERTGVGGVVDMSLYTTGMWMISQAISAANIGRRQPPISRLTTFNPLVNFYPTRDERWICLVMLQADRWWPDLARHIGRPDLIDNPTFSTAEARQENIGVVVETLDAIFKTRTLDEWSSALATAEGVWAPVLSPEDICEDQQALACGFLPSVVTGDGSSLRVVASPAQFDEKPIGELRRAPEHGEHTEEILLELGCDWADIGDFKERGIIG
jgi:formyl-CoA transferase